MPTPNGGHHHTYSLKRIAIIRPLAACNHWEAAEITILTIRNHRQTQMRKLFDFSCFRLHKMEALRPIPNHIRPERHTKPLLSTYFYSLLIPGDKFGNVKMILSDWIFLAVLGVLVAFLSISVDMMIYYFQEDYEWKEGKQDGMHGSPSILYPLHQLQAMTLPISNRFDKLPISTSILSFLSWCAYTVGMVVASATFVHYISPQAIGSGIPEMKTIIRGVFGVAMSLGSGAPIGKMGPFVHIASVVANQLSCLASIFDPAFASEARRAECLAAACAVGVACTFSAPVGGQVNLRNSKVMNLAQEKLLRLATSAEL
ncbi:hypothetical protein DICVIV_11338, partial [Dictyocaulus viviparus]